MMRKRNSDPMFPDDSTHEKRERKAEDGETEIITGNGRSVDDEEMINVVDVSDSEERMDATEGPQSISVTREDVRITPGPSIAIESSTSMSSLSTASSAAASLPLDLSKKKRRLTASTSLTEDDHKDDDGDYSDSDQRQRKGIAGFSGTRGGSFGAGTSASSSSTSSAIKWRMKPLECETPSRGQSPSVIVGSAAEIMASLHQHSILNRNASEAWQIQQQQRPSVIRSADFSFEPPESTDVDEHFRKSLSGGQATTEMDAKVDDHFARALGDVWWALKNRMHLTSTGEDGTASRSSPSPASISSSTTSNCVVASNFTSSLSSSSSSSQSTTVSQVEITTKCASTTFPSSTPLKKRILSKAAVEAAAQRLEMNNRESAQMSNNNVGGGQDGYCDRINNNNGNSNNSDEDSRKSLSAPSTPPPTPL